MRKREGISKHNETAGVLLEVALALPLIVTFGAATLEFGASLQERAFLTRKAAEATRMVARSASLASEEAFCCGDNGGLRNLTQNLELLKVKVSTDRPDPVYNATLEAINSDLSGRWRVMVTVSRRQENSLSFIRRFTDLASVEVSTLAHPQYIAPTEPTMYNCATHTCSI